APTPSATKCRSRWSPPTRRAAASRWPWRTPAPPRPSAGSPWTTSRLRRSRSSAGRPRGALRQGRVGLRAGHRLARGLVVKKDEVAVDEGPEERRPADAHLVLLLILA